MRGQVYVWQVRQLSRSGGDPGRTAHLRELGIRIDDDDLIAERQNVLASSAAKIEAAPDFNRFMRAACRHTAFARPYR